VSFVVVVVVVVVVVAPVVKLQEKASSDLFVPCTLPETNIAPKD